MSVTELLYLMIFIKIIPKRKTSNIFPLQRTFISTLHPSPFTLHPSPSTFNPLPPPYTPVHPQYPSSRGSQVPGGNPSPSIQLKNYVAIRCSNTGALQYRRSNSVLGNWCLIVSTYLIAPQKGLNLSSYYRIGSRFHYLANPTL